MKSNQYFMNLTVITIVLAYFAFLSLVLLTFRFMKSRDLTTAEDYVEEEKYQREFLSA